MTDVHRVAASTAPRASRLAGSPEWCYQTLNLLQESYKHVSTDHKRFAKYLDELREYKAWERVPIDHPYGSEPKMLMAELGKRVDEIEAQLKATRKDLRGATTKAADAEDLANQWPVGTNQYSEGVSNAENVRNRRPVGETVAYALRKLRADRPDIHKRVLDGELTAHAGMVEAGFRKKRVYKRITTLDKIQKLWVKLDHIERMEHLDWTLKHCATCGRSGATNGMWCDACCDREA